MALSANKTKFILAVGPAFEAPPILEQMIEDKMNVAWLHSSPCDFADHQQLEEKRSKNHE
jgi:pyruvate kinase